MAVGNAVLDVVLEPGFLEHVRDAGLRFRQGLARIADTYPGVVEEIRGEGLMIGLKCKVPNAEVIKALRDQHVLTVGAGENVVRLVPPLTIETADIDLTLDRVDAACAAVAAGHGGESGEAAQ
jgi:acetylornithine/N-succinyldiaminopimelate aminotransferase